MACDAQLLRREGFLASIGGTPVVPARMRVLPLRPQMAPRNGRWGFPSWPAPSARREGRHRLAHPGAGREMSPVLVVGPGSSLVTAGIFRQVFWCLFTSWSCFEGHGLLRVSLLGVFALNHFSSWHCLPSPRPGLFARPVP